MGNMINDSEVMGQKSTEGRTPSSTGNLVSLLDKVVKKGIKIDKDKTTTRILLFSVDSGLHPDEIMKLSF